MTNLPKDPTKVQDSWGLSVQVLKMGIFTHGKFLPTRSKNPKIHIIFRLPQVKNHLTRNFATLGQSLLPPTSSTELVTTQKGFRETKHPQVGEFGNLVGINPQILKTQKDKPKSVRKRQPPPQNSTTPQTQFQKTKQKIFKNPKKPQKTNPKIKPKTTNQNKTFKFQEKFSKPLKK
jgi:hypothetical protein